MYRSAKKGHVYPYGEKEPLVVGVMFLAHGKTNLFGLKLRNFAREGTRKREQRDITQERSQLFPWETGEAACFLGK